MKRKSKFVSALLITGLFTVGVLTPTFAADRPITLDMTSFTMPTVAGLQTGDSITLKISGLTGSQGVYASLCRSDVTSATKATLCDTDQSRMAWITATGGFGSAAASAGGVITAVNAFGDVNCLIDSCSIYVRGDHNNTSAFQLVRKIPVTFISGGAIKAKDSVTGTAGTFTLTPNVPNDLYYRTPITFNLTAASGLKITLKSLTPDCAVDKMKVYAVAGNTVCAIAATTSGNDIYQPLNVNFPFYTHPLTQSVSVAWPEGPLVKGTVTTIKRVFSNFRIPVNLVSSDTAVCTVRGDSKKWYVTARNIGTCILTATAPADPSVAHRWTSGSSQVSLTVKSG